MLGSVRAGGVAAAVFVSAVFGAIAPAQAQVATQAPATALSAIATAPAPAPVAAPAATVTPALVAPAAFAAPAPAAAPAPVAAPTAPVVSPAAPAEVSTLPTASAAPAVRRSLAELATTLASTEVVNADHECLANAVYFEARGEPLAGQLAVAEVVLNRARSGRYPPDVCKVVKQPAQFSFVRRGQFPRADRSSDAWRRAVAIAKVAQDKLATELPKNVLWYHATYVAPDWGKRLTRKAKIGLHIFYS